MVLGTLVCWGALMGTVSAQTSTPAAPSAPANAAQSQPKPNPDLDAANAALAAGRLKEAQRLFEQAVAAEYTNPDAHFGLGLTLYRVGDLTGARFEFQQLVRLAPERYEGHFNLGVVAARAREYDDALAAYRKALELARGKASNEAVLLILDAIATELERRRNYAELAGALEEALKLSPDDDRTRYDLAMAKYRAGEGVDALPLVYAVLQRQPRNADAALLVADIFEAQKLPERGLREIDKVVAATDSNVDKARLLVRKAGLLVAVSNFQAAVQSLRAAATADPEDARIQARLGDLLATRNDRPGALAAFQTAVKLEPADPAYRASLAGVHLALGQIDAARTQAQLAVRTAKDPDVGARGAFVLGVANYRQGRFAEARTALQSAALRLRNADTYLWLGLSEYALKNYPAAVTALEASVKVTPTPAARSNLGAALLATGRYAEAEATLRGVVAELPKNGEAWYHLGWSVRGQGREAEARKAFQTSLALGYDKAKGALR